MTDLEKRIREIVVAYDETFIYDGGRLIASEDGGQAFLNLVIEALLKGEDYA